MAASLEPVRSYLTGVYGEAFAKQLIERADIHKLLVGDRPARLKHFEEPTDEQRAEFEAWKAEYKRLADLGWEKGWLENDWDNGTQIVHQQPRIVVYDETEEEWRERAAAWEALQPVAPSYVAFPIVHRAGPIQTTDPREGER